MGNGRGGLAGGGRGGRDPPHPRPQRCCRRSGSPAGSGRRAPVPSSPARSLIEHALGDPPRPRPPRRPHRRRDASSRSARRARSRCRTRLDPGFAEALRAAGIERLYSHQLAALEAAAGERSDHHQRHRLGQVAGLQPAGARTGSPPTRSAAPSTSTRPRRWPRTRRESSRRCGRRGCARRSTTATPRARSARRSAAAPTSSSPTPTCSTSASSPTTASGATSSPTSAGWWSTRPTPTAASSAPTSPTSCAACAASPPPTAPSRASSSPRRRSPTRVELAERLVGTGFELIDDDGAPARGARGRDLEPAADRRGDRDAALGALRGGRPARRPGGAGGADDLLPAQPPRDRADPALRPREPRRPRQARAGRADRPLPGRLHAAAAPRDRAPARRGRAAGGGRHRRAGAGDRRRRARRRDLRHLPRHGRQPQADVGAGRPPASRPRRLRRRPGRPRSVLLPPPRGVPRAAGRGGDPRPLQRADRRPPSARRRLRAAAHRGGRRGLRRGLARAGGAAGRSRRAAPGGRAGCCRGEAASSPRGYRCAPPRPTRSR